MADIIHGILVMIGIVLLVLGTRLFLSSRAFRETGIKTQATVIDNLPGQSKDGVMMYTPLLEYDVKGVKKTYTPNTRSNPPAYDIGERVVIVYSPKNNHNVRIVSYWGIYLGSTILFALGLPLLVIGSGYFLFKWGII
ncbi:DUF3592 domain-containing protein [Empedobacter brevis]|uniref:DUF3592 domain-containing protein n=1 Tax=Empedobacter brevis TaxID=247 RepID=UPI002FE3B0CF